MPGFAETPALLATVSRSGRVESRHYGALVVMRAGRVEHARGDIDTGVYCRSAVKPLQALPVVAALGDDLAAPELALMCASHGGDEAHLAVVRGLLSRVGLDPQALRCGPHPPLADAARLRNERAGTVPAPLHNNCSGKHAGFLAFSQRLAVDPRHYLDPEGTVQKEIRRAVTAMMDLPADAPVGLDGCGAPTFFVPLTALARAFARLTTPSAAPPEWRAACEKVTAAMANHPTLVAWEGHFTTALLAAAPGVFVGKNGAEGVFVVGVAGQDLAVAVKIADGGSRACAPVVLDTLRHLGVLSEAALRSPALAAHTRPELLNTQGSSVGHLEATVWG